MTEGLMQEVDTVVVFSGGRRPPREVLDLLPAGAAIVGADRGAAHALELGLRVELAIGDFDSIPPAALERLERYGTRIERYAPDKDETDLELALAAARSFRPRRILVVGGSTGRLDHRLAELLALGSATLAELEVDALLGGARVHVIRGERRLGGRPGELISLLAPYGQARGVVSEGLVYPLRGDALEPGSARGLSNLFDAEKARVTVAAGVVLALLPGRRASPLVLSRARDSVREGSGSSSRPSRGQPRG
jgi:thiamine pyrophosphokinase